VPGARRADHPGMTNHDRSARSAAKGVGGVVLAVIVVNVLVRLVPLPDIDLPSISSPDVPAWIDTAVTWVHWIVKVKNWLLAGIVAVFIVLLAIDELEKRRDA